MSSRHLLVAGATALTLVAAAVPGVVAQEPLKVNAAYSSVIEEPWDGVIHAALEEEAAAGRIVHTWQDGIGYDGGMELALREIAESESPDIIFGDSFGNEEAVRRVAADYPEIPFVFGSGGGPAEPNFSVFDNWIHEPAFLAGWVAGGMTKSNIIGVVAGYPVPEVNRITNAFIAGAQAKNPAVEVKVTFINSWFDPPKAKEAAFAMIDKGADVMYAERFGVSDAAKERKVLAIGNVIDTQKDYPDTVVASALWNMEPTIDRALKMVKDGKFTAEDYGQYSMMKHKGSELSPLGTFEKKVPAEIVAKVKARQAEILAGKFTVKVNDTQPKSGK